MSGTRFGALDLTANTDTELMSGPVNFTSTVNVRFVNRNTSSVKVRLALVDAAAGLAVAALSDEDYLEFDATIKACEVLENTGLVVPEDFTLVARSDTEDVTAIAFGFQEKNS